MKFRVALAALTSVVMSLIPLAEAKATTMYGAELPLGIAVPLSSHSGMGPHTLVEGQVTWSSSINFSFSGYYHTETGYGFASNGYWNDINMIGLGSDTGTITIRFDTPVYGVGALINYSTEWAAPSVSVYDSEGHQIAWEVLSFETAGGLNSGELIYFLESSPIIASMRLTRAYIGLTDLQYQNTLIAETPLPAALPLFGGGLGLMSLFGWWRRRSRQPLG